ncbi:hypothetical protein JKP88DRAFT_173119, partial [Tribonema minus]
MVQAGVTLEPWYYLDPQGNRQGPFSSHDMREWFEAGYFVEGLPLAQGIDRQFRAMSQLFPDASQAFV